ncbi:MAG: flagellar hook-associated protein 3 [Chitinivibrionales bacterium]|nr:flagellar hook-associated protein 3 [Chitinivibrionales bacterium]MBD3396541.1 flagellar hook-associated protein 3 [Chitinivibrionales bacterium]
MRITFKTLNRHAQNVIHDRYANLAKLQEQLATGRRLLRPSDDPVDVSNDLKLRAKVSALAQYKRNIEDGTGWMAVTDTAMVSMNELMQRLRELAIQAASDSQTITERRYIAKEVEQLTRQMISLTNTNYKGDYVFAGTQTKITPYPLDSSKASSAQNYADLDMAFFDSSGGTDVPVQIRDAFDNSAITNILPGTLKLVAPDSFGTPTTWVEGRDYTVDYAAGTITILSTGTDPAALAVDVSDGGTFAGPNYDINGFRLTFEHVTKGTDIYGDEVENTGDVLREVEEGIVTPINISGDELIKNNETGTNMISELIRFGQSLLQSDTGGIENAIGRIDDHFQVILAAEAKNGARVNRFETTLERNEQQYVESTRLQSELEDADLTDTITDFSLAETVYNAALKSAARVIQPSLVDFL